MVVEVEMRVPGAPPAELRREVMARAPRAGEQTCPGCGVDRFHLLEALMDGNSWENRAIAMSLVRGCRTCLEEVSNVLAAARVPLALGRREASTSRFPPNDLIR